MRFQYTLSSYLNLFCLQLNVIADRYRGKETETERYILRREIRRERERDILMRYIEKDRNRETKRHRERWRREKGRDI